MKPLKCGTCITCCRWATDISLRPLLVSDEGGRYENMELDGDLVLAAKPNGDCVYLGYKGCTIYKTRPSQCRTFDCRVLYEQMASSTFIKVILQGQKKFNGQ